MHSNLVNRNHIIVLFAIWLLVHAVLFFYPGIRLELFDSKVYTNAGDHFMQFGSFEKSHQIFYAIPIILIGAFNSLPGGLFFFILFQSVTSAVATYAIYRSASLLFNDSRAGLIGGTLFLISWDTIQWNTALLTESLFCSLICFLIFHLARFKASRLDFIGIFLFLGILSTTRPTGIIFIVGTILFLFVRYKSLLREETGRKWIMIALTVVIAVFGAISMFSIWDFTDQYIRGNIVTYIDTAEGNDFGLRLDNTNMVLPDNDDSPLEKMVSFIVHNPIHFIHAAFLKIIYLLSGFRPYYSLYHNALSITWNVLIYGLFATGYQHASQPIRVFALAVIIINCLLIGISTVDWDNRFYVPMAPVLVLIAAGGGFHLLKKFFALKSSQ